MKTIKHPLPLVLIFLLFTSSLFGQTSKNNYTGSWSNSQSWIGGNIPDGTKDGTINIYGYITSSANLTFSKITTINVYDTLVIEGDLDLGKEATISVSATGLLIIVGDYLADKDAIISNGGKFIVAGNYTQGKESTIINTGRMFLYDNTPEFGSGSTTPNNIEDETDLQQDFPNIYQFIEAIQNGQSATLPIVLGYFTCSIEYDHTSNLKFSTISEQNFDYFSIERSADAKTYTEIGTVKGSGWSQTRKDYSFIDKNPLPGMNYYRLKAVDFDGYTEYFPPISVFNKDLQVKVVNTVRDKNLTIYSNLEADFKLISLTGMEVYSGQIFNGQNDQQLPAFLAKGIYSLIIYKDNHVIAREKVFMQ